ALELDALVGEQMAVQQESLVLFLRALLEARQTERPIYPGVCGWLRKVLKGCGVYRGKRRRVNTAPFRVRWAGACSRVCLVFYGRSIPYQRTYQRRKANGAARAKPGRPLNLSG